MPRMLSGLEGLEPFSLLILTRLLLVLLQSISGWSTSPGLGTEPVVVQSSRLLSAKDTCRV